MKLSAAEHLAHTLIVQHGFDEDLEFGFNNRKNALGICKIRYGKAYRIELSKIWTEALTEDEVRDTLLHEIAHAMTPLDGHGAKWRAAARLVGANPKRTAEEVPLEVQRRVNKMHAKYRAECFSCENVVYFNRMTKNWRSRAYVCGTCRNPFHIASNQ